MTTFKINFIFDEDIFRTIAMNIRKYQKEKKITHEQLAVNIGVSSKFYGQFEIS